MATYTAQPRATVTGIKVTRAPKVQTSKVVASAAAVPTTGQLWPRSTK